MNNERAMQLYRCAMREAEALRRACEVRKFNRKNKRRRLP